MDGASEWRTQGRLDALAANEEKNKEEEKRIRKSLEDDWCILPASIMISFDQVLDANFQAKNLEHSHLRRSYLDMAETSTPPPWLDEADPEQITQEICRIHLERRRQSRGRYAAKVKQDRAKQKAKLRVATTEAHAREEAEKREAGERAEQMSTGKYNVTMEKAYSGRNDQVEGRMAERRVFNPAKQE